MSRRLQYRCFGVATIVLMCALVGCSRPNTKSMQTLLDKLSHGPESEVGGLIYGYSQASPGAQQVLLGMLRPLRAPSPDKHMSIEASRDAGRFTMLVVRAPWPLSPQGPGLHPIIICRDEGREQVVGYVLPFNDILHHFRGADSDSIMQLSQWWIQSYAKAN
jgi:hypothetical protein